MTAGLTELPVPITFRSSRIASRSNSSSGTTRSRATVISPLTQVRPPPKSRSPPTRAHNTPVSPTPDPWLSSRRSTSSSSFHSGSASSSSALLSPATPLASSPTSVGSTSRSSTPDRDYSYRGVDYDLESHRIRIISKHRKASAFDMSAAAGHKRKVVILGSPSVGKTSLTQQFVTPPTYNDAYYPTIEATSQKTVKYHGMEYDCEIVDTAGQDEFSLFPPKYAVGVHGYMLVYSIASRQSFDMILTLHEKILDQSGQERVPCVIVGQKSDLNSERRVTRAEGEALAKKLDAAFIESSARDNQNVDRAFDALLAEMQREYNPEPEKKKSGWWPFS